MNRYAVLIGSGEFPKEPKLPPLRCPVRDVEGMAAVLSSEVHGPYEVLRLTNENSGNVRQELYRVLRSAGHEDLVLIYYSGHGKLDPHGNLYLATADTVLDFLPTSAVMFDEIRRFGSMSKVSRSVIILDCCFSGAAGSDDWQFRGDVASQAEQLLRRPWGSGRGSYLLTASTETQLAIEREGDEYGLLTKHILSGITDAAADRDDDGQVSMQELLLYVQEKVAAEGKQQPQGWGSNLTDGELYIAATGRPPKDHRRTSVLQRFYDVLARTNLPARPVRLALTMLDSQSDWSEDVASAAADSLQKLYQCGDRTPDLVSEILRISQWVETNVPCAGTDALRRILADRDRLCEELQAQQVKLAELQTSLEQAGKQEAVAAELRDKLKETEAALAAAKRADKKSAARLKEAEAKVQELEQQLAAETAWHKKAAARLKDQEGGSDTLRQQLDDEKAKHKKVAARLKEESAKSEGLRRELELEKARAKKPAEKPPVKSEPPPAIREFVKPRPPVPSVAERLAVAFVSFVAPGNDFYCVPNIPAAKLANAAQSTGVDPAQVLALVDCTVFGSAKNCIVFTPTELRHKNTGLTTNCAYTNLAKLGKIDLAGSNFKKETLQALLIKIAAIVG